MKAMSKQQLADLAGVSVRTLSRWCEPHHDELWLLGYRPTMKVLPPRVVAYLSEKLSIDLGEP